MSGPVFLEDPLRRGGQGRSWRRKERGTRRTITEIRHYVVALIDGNLELLNNFAFRRATAHSGGRPVSSRRIWKISRGAVEVRIPYGTSRLRFGEGVDYLSVPLADGNPEQAVRRILVRLRREVDAGRLDPFLYAAEERRQHSMMRAQDKRAERNAQMSAAARLAAAKIAADTKKRRALAARDQTAGSRAPRAIGGTDARSISIVEFTRR